MSDPCSVCRQAAGRAVNFKYNVQDKADAAPHQENCRLIACDGCIRQVSFIAERVLEQRQIGFMPAMVDCLRRMYDLAAPRAVQYHQAATPEEGGLAYFLALLDDDLLEN